jgi:hypothetical protein
MRFDRLHRTVLVMLAWISAIPLLTSSELSGFVGPLFCGVLLLGGVLPGRWMRGAVVRWGISAGLLAFLLIQIWRILGGLSPVVAILEFAPLVMAARMWLRMRYSSDWQIVLLSLVTLVGGTLTGPDLLYGVVVVLFILICPLALLLTGLRKEMETRFYRDPDAIHRLMQSRRVLSMQVVRTTVWMGALVMVMTVLIFLIFPRWGMGSGVSLLDPTLPGFSSEVRIGDLEETMENTTVYLRLIPLTDGSTRSGMRNRRFRGMVYDEYRQGVWVQSNFATFGRLVGEGPGDMFVFTLPKTRVTPARFRVLQKAVHPPLLFFPEGTFVVRTGFVNEVGRRRPRYLEINDTGVLRYEEGSGLGSRHEIWLGDAPIPQGKTTHLRRWLVFPQEMEPVRELAARYAQSGSVAFRAQKILRELRSRYSYARTLTPQERRQGKGASPLENFLFHHGKGTCEHFATAAVLMLRAEGIPARYVTGFLGAKWNRLGGYWSVNAEAAHAWVEMYIDGKWVTADPTPSLPGSSQRAASDRITASMIVDVLMMKWQDHVVGYDLGIQRKLLERFRQATSWLLSLKPMGYWKILGILGIGGLGIALLLRWRFRRNRCRQRAGRGSLRASSGIRAAQTLLTHLESGLQRIGGRKRRPNETPLEYIEALENLTDAQRFSARELLRVYHQCRFGGRRLPRERQRRILKTHRTAFRT